MNDDLHQCPHCREEVQPDNDFCPHCGELRAEGVLCSRHPAEAASGACIVCASPFCPSCGSRVKKRFLCHDHAALEIYEGMARAFGSSDAVQVEFAKSSLETAGFHPFVFARKVSPLSIGSPDYTLFRVAGEYDGHIINEYKLMVPCQEVLEAELKLRELGFIGEETPSSGPAQPLH